MMTLVYFRSGSVDQAAEVFGMLWNPGYINCRMESVIQFLEVAPHIWLFLLVFLVMDLWIVRERIDSWLGKFHWIIRWMLYGFALISIWVFGGAINHPFVYFQF
jgi:fumarate reductase subunit D